ncbi:hypothetical protein FOA52_008287 [Chlamydomonas sp. UWO 241]|nr:hypothetical protein FOA52_008287 [Chlamydomonas sp. UWO 241]
MGMACRASVDDAAPSTGPMSMDMGGTYGGSMCDLEVSCDSDGWTSGVVRGARIKYNDPRRLSLRRRGVLNWEPGKPLTVLIIKKICNEPATAAMLALAGWLRARGLTVLAEPTVCAAPGMGGFVPLTAESKSTVDLCITLGGDGTVLHLASLFESDDPMPPVMSFSMGTLGFLTPFDVTDYPSLLERVLDGPQAHVTLHSRMHCELHQGGKLKVSHTVLNEAVIDRGAYSGATMLELFIDDAYVTTVEADGLIIATPSGSTAYSMSAGGSLIAPSVPCTIISPIAPLSLSFRPIVIPETSIVCVRLPLYARSNARVSFDGRKPMPLTRGSSVMLRSTENALPMVNMSRLDTDWFEGITQKLKWNLSLRPSLRPPGEDHPRP